MFSPNDVAQLLELAHGLNGVGGPVALVVALFIFIRWAERRVLPLLAHDAAVKRATAVKLGVTTADVKRELARASFQPKEEPDGSSQEAPPAAP